MSLAISKDMDPMRRLQIELDLSSEDIDKYLKVIAQKFEPDMNPGGLLVKKLSGGFTNVVYRITEGINDNLGILIRVASRNITCNPLDYQLQCMQAAYDVGMGAEPLGSFTNGIVYRYIPGDILNPDMYNTYSVRRKVVEMAAEYGNTTNVPAQNEDGKAEIQKVIDRMVDLIPDNMDMEEIYGSGREILASKARIQEEVSWVKSEVEDLCCPQVFSHGDLWWSNVIYQHESDKMFVIDYDFSGQNGWPYDLSRFLAMANVKVAPYRFEFLESGEEKKLCRDYIIKSRQIRGICSEATEKDVERTYAYCLLFKLVSQTLNIAAVPGTRQFMDPALGVDLFALELEKAYIKAKADYVAYKKLNHQSFVKAWSPWLQ